MPMRAEITPTLTPIPSSTPLPPPTETPSPSPTVAPTPMPAERLEFGETSLFIGDYETALKEFELARDKTSDNEMRAEAETDIGRVYLAQRNYSAAINQLKAVLANYPESDVTAETWYFLAETYVAVEAYPEAAEAFLQYLERRPQPLAGYVQEQRGDALLSAGQSSAAASAYEAALQSPPPGDPVWLRLKLARAYIQKADQTAAVTLLLDIYQTSTNTFAQAQANWLLGQIYLSLDETDQAYARFQDSVTNFPQSYDAYLGLVELVNAGQTVSDLERGIVDYYAGQYSLCVEALTRYIENGLAGDGEALYYRGLCRRDGGQSDEALADFEAIIANGSGDAYWSRAYDEMAYTLWAYQDDYLQAAELLTSYVSLAPDASDAPVNLYEAGRILERAGMLVEAAARWQQLAETYPAYDRSSHALLLAGVSHYRLGDPQSARTIFQRTLVLNDDPEIQAAALLWVGKTYQLEGNPDKARDAWTASIQKDPTGYYSERAAQLLVDRPPFQLDNPFNLGYDLNEERADAESWLRQTFQLPPETDLNGLGNLAQEAAFLRGEELYRLGRYAEARNEFESLRQASLNDPVATYRLMNFLLQRSLYRSAILSSRQILDLAGMDDAGTLRAPRYFNHIRFGIYFRDLVLDAAQNEELNPLFLLSVIRQESLFEAFAQSGAGARGLMQIIPATGQELASQLSWPPDYTTADLDRPYISIPFGARYLSRQRDYFDGSLFAALAAYNGGPGNTLAWDKIAAGDPDLLLEVIRAEETRNYIRQIFEFYNIYRLIYEQKP